MDPRLKSCTLYYDAALTDPYYLRARVNSINIYDEKVMSMPQLQTFMNTTQCIHSSYMTVKNGTYFFFIYNFENYYHFLYDTLPYLNFYLTLSPRPKLLIQKDHKFLKFQTEMLSLLGVDIEKNIEFAEEAIYEKLYVATSLTHGKLLDGSSASNLPPDIWAYNIWKKLGQSVIYNLETPKKIYVSRRSHIHGDASNIGTNYTTRRRCLNEDAVVDLLISYGYKEVFCETMTTEEKIATFKNATHILGFIGGGMANALFSPSHVKVVTVLTPEFNRINARFKYSMNHCDFVMLDITNLAYYDGAFPPYVRVQITDSNSPFFNKIGEVDAYIDGKYKIKLSNTYVAGFALDANYTDVVFTASQLTPLDNGLNSPFVCDIEALKVYLDADIKINVS